MGQCPTNRSRTNSAHHRYAQNRRRSLKCQSLRVCIGLQVTVGGRRLTSQPQQVTVGGRRLRRRQQQQQHQIVVLSSFKM